MTADGAEEHSPVPSYLRVISLRVPATTPYDPLVAEQLIQGIFALSNPVSLIISREDEQAEWLIEVARPDREAIVKLLYSLYPQAEIVVRHQTRTAVGYRVFEFAAGAPFIAPLKAIREMKSDALVGIIGALTELRAGEHCSYELLLRPITERHYELGERMLQTSTVSWWRFLHPRWALGALAEKALRVDRLDRYVQRDQRIAEGKLGSPLKQARLLIKIRTSGSERARKLVSFLNPALAVFEREGLNYLTPVSSMTYPLVLSPSEAAALWHLANREHHFPGIVWAKSTSRPLPARVAESRDGIRIGTNTFQGRERTVYLSDADRVTHANLIGKTRTGKSTLLYWQIRQDVSANRGVAVIDPHGDLIEALVSSAIPARREKDVVLFDVADKECVIGLNLLQAPTGVPRDVAADQALSVIHKLFADQWSETRMEDTLYALLNALIGFKGATLLDVPRFLTDARFRSQVLEHVTDPVTLHFWRQEYDPLSERYQREIARPITNRVRKFYRSEQLRRIICQPQSLDFVSILDEKKTFLANLRGSISEESNTLGALLISKLQMAAMSRAGRLLKEREPYYLYIDEAQNFVTTSLPRLFSEAGKYGLSLTLANQYLEQLSGSTLEAVMGNVGTSIIFRVGPRDAQAFSRFTKPYFSGEDLLNLNRFSAVVTTQQRGETLPPFTMRTLPPPQRPTDAQERTERIRAQSRTAYARPSADIEQELESRLKGTDNEHKNGEIQDIREVNFFD